MQGENYEPQINLAGLESRSLSSNQRRQMLLAFILLVAALTVLAVRYRPFWFDSLNFPGKADQVSSETIEQSAQPSTIARPSHRANAKLRTVATPEVESEPAVATPVQQTVLSPLQVDVTYANGRHQTLVARDLAVHLSFSPETAEALIKPVQPVYPPLAQESNVQGSVVLMAKIASDGSVYSVQVISGPEILASAAVEAVRQWRFKARVDGGQAIPAETRITVNFSISTP